MSVQDGRVSVIIPAYNAPQLHATLVSLDAPSNAMRIAEVIVVGPARCCDREHSQVVRFLPQVTPVTAPVARNIGIRSAASEWLAFIDADCQAAPDWLGVLYAAGEAGHDVLGGGVAFAPAGYWADVHNISMLHDYHLSARAGSRPFLPTLNLLVHREVVARVGLMNEALRRAQDLEWTARMAAAGIELWFEPQAVVTHAPGRAAGSLWRDYYDTGRISYAARAALGLPLPLARFGGSQIMLRWLSPLIATGAALRPFRNRAFHRHLTRLPGVWYTKLAWCMGASARQ